MLDFLTICCVCYVGFCLHPPTTVSSPPPHATPPLPPPPPVTQHSLICPLWWHWQEMTSRTENESTPSHNKPLHLSSKVSRVMGESVHGGVSAWGGWSVHVLEMCTRVDSEQLSWAESLSVVFVWTVLWYFPTCVTIHVCECDSLKRWCASVWKTLPVKHRMDARGMSGICLK